ncbi:BadF/BadG/BcrA/BcrD ATPase family protein, partial [Mesorhizobium sp.]
MSASAASPHYFLGVDGGGTGCRARIEDEAGTVLGQGLSGPATTRLGIDAAWASVEKAFDAAIEEAGFEAAEIARIHAGIGLAGIGRKGALEAFRAIAHPFASIDFVSDGAAACLGAHSGQDGAIVIAGTGSI